METPTDFFGTDQSIFGAGKSIFGTDNSPPIYRDLYSWRSGFLAAR